MHKAKSSRGHHSVTQLFAHLVFVTKGRVGFLDPQRKDDVEKQFAEDCRQISERHCHLVAFGMEEDHVHLVIRYPPKVSISQLVKHLKGRSSQTGLPGASKKGSALWSSGYFAKSVSDQAMDETAGYARNQGMPEKQSKRTSRPVAKVVHAKPQHASG